MFNLIHVIYVLCGVQYSGTYIHVNAKPIQDVQEPVNLTVYVLHNLTNGQYPNLSTNGGSLTEDDLKKHFQELFKKKLTEDEGVTARTRDRGTVASTNGTLCTSEPNAAIVRHFYTKPNFYWRTASALAYMCGSEPIDYFSSLTTENFTKVVKKLLTCHKPGAEESVEPTSTGTEEDNTPTVPGIISC
ncbi:hypothetical protein MRX96_055462 [Rhipicephalus microplus]